MKILRSTLLMAVIIFFYGSNRNAVAQGHGKKHHDKKHEQHSYHKYDNRWDFDHVHPKGRKYQDRHVHYSTRYHHAHRAPRYVYYRDYNVYFDRRQQIFILYSGREWVAIKTLPRVMRGVDLNRVAIYHVDYYDGNLRGYLHARRPAYF